MSQRAGLALRLAPSQAWSRICAQAAGPPLMWGSWCSAPWVSLNRMLMRMLSNWKAVGLWGWPMILLFSLFQQGSPHPSRGSGSGKPPVAGGRKGRGGGGRGVGSLHGGRSHLGTGLGLLWFRGGVRQNPGKLVPCLSHMGEGVGSRWRGGCRCPV